MDDMALLREYAGHDSEVAFETLVSRRIGFVYSAALRQVRDPHLAGEITQAVFIILAQKAGKISDKTILTGWLFKTTRFAALAQIRAKLKRSLRTATIEKEFQMQSEFQSAANDEIWNQMSPLLDEALASLGKTDRQAVLLRFFENKTLAEVGNSLGTGEDTARKRVSRTLEKLHRYFSKRGVSSTTAIIAGAISANSVQAAPVTLAKSVTAMAIAKGAAASISTLTLIKGALKIMAWTKAKTTIIVGVAAILAAGTTTIVVKKIKTETIDKSLWGNPDPTFESLAKAPPVLILRPTQFANSSGSGVQQNYKMIFKHWPLRNILASAYGFSEFRIVFPTNLPQNSYDLALTLPNHQQQALRDEIQKQLHLAGTREVRETDVMLLKIKNPSQLQSKITKGGQPLAYGNFDRFGEKTIFTNKPLSVVATQTEQLFKKPVIDKTESTNHYDLSLYWYDITNQLDQDGLELVSSREPIDVLVVEKVK